MEVHIINKKLSTFPQSRNNRNQITMTHILVPIPNIITNCILKSVHFERDTIQSFKIKVYLNNLYVKDDQYLNEARLH